MKVFYLLIAYLFKYRCISAKHRALYLRTVKGKKLFVKSKIALSHADVTLDITDYIQFYMFLEGTYELDMCRYLSTKIQHGTFIDVGANVGSYTLSLYKEAVKIVAFEASAQNCNYLQAAIQANKITNIDLIHKAVDKTSGQSARLSLSEDNSGHHSMHYHWGQGYEEVKTISVDDYCADNGIKNVKAIKLDIEGNEYNAVFGAAQTINKQKPIIVCEFNSYSSKEAGYTLFDLYTLILSFGYEAFTLDNNNLKRYDTKDLSILGYIGNIIFTSALLGQ